MRRFLTSDLEQRGLLRGEPAQGRDGKMTGELGDQRTLRPPSRKTKKRHHRQPRQPAQLGGVIALIAGLMAISGQMPRTSFEIVYTKAVTLPLIVEDAE